MADIMHLFRIEASRSEVYRALTTADGVRRWWTPDADLESHVGGAGVFRFYGGSKVTQVVINQLVPSERVVWTVSTSFRPEWIGTTIQFDLRPLAGKTEDGTELFFAHRGYPAADDDYAICTTGWGVYLTKLKDCLAPS